MNNNNIIMIKQLNLELNKQITNNDININIDHFHANGYQRLSTAVNGCQQRLPTATNGYQQINEK